MQFKMIRRGNIVQLLFSGLRNRMVVSFSTKPASGEIGSVDYGQICNIIEAVSKKSGKDAPVLIDVRPPTEIKSSGGTIPTAKNIPLAEVNEAFNATPEDFSAKYGFTKPDQKQPLVFFCHAGVRCRSAAEVVKALGYTSLSYPGSWSEWQQQCKK